MQAVIHVSINLFSQSLCSSADETTARSPNLAVRLSMIYAERFRKVQKSEVTAPHDPIVLVFGKRSCSFSIS